MSRREKVTRAILVTISYCILFLLIAILFLSILKFLNILAYDFYGKIVPLFLSIFWGLIIFSEFLIQPYILSFVKEEFSKIYLKKPLEFLKEVITFNFVLFKEKKLIIFFLFPFSFILILESFCLFEVNVIVWFIIIILSFVAVMNKVNPQGWPLHHLHLFFKVLGLSIGILAIVYGIFREPLLREISKCDKVMFSNLAAYNGDNYNDILELKLVDIAEKDPENIADAPFLETFDIYVKRLNGGKLEFSLYPFHVINKKMIHNIFIRKFFYTEFTQKFYSDDITGFAGFKEIIVAPLLEYFSCILVDPNNYYQKIYDEEMMLGDPSRYPIEGEGFFREFINILTFNQIVSIEAYQAPGIEKIKIIYEQMECERGIPTHGLGKFINSSGRKVEPCQ